MPNSFNLVLSAACRYTCVGLNTVGVSEASFLAVLSLLLQPRILTFFPFSPQNKVRNRLTATKRNRYLNLSLPAVIFRHYFELTLFSILSSDRFPQNALLPNAHFVVRHFYCKCAFSCFGQKVQSTNSRRFGGEGLNYQ